jgi:deoxyribodipyrimidine photo-lyase
MVCDGVVEPERIKHLNDNPNSKAMLIIYWMQQSQRTRFNHALNYAIDQANQLKLPLIVYFGLTDKYPEANLRHYQFMLEGLMQVQKELKSSAIQFVIRKEDPSKGIIKISDEATLVVVDRGYTRIQREWRNQVATEINCPIIQVESDVIVPIETTSNKEEYGAFTIRPKINRFLDRFLRSISNVKLKIPSQEYDFKSLYFDDIESVMKNLSLDNSVYSSSMFNGGMHHAQKLLDYFLKNHFDQFPYHRNDPSRNVCSNLSPYLHFGQISPIDIALQIKKSNPHNASVFLEELIIRRELAMNFVYYNNRYDTLFSLPQWAYQTLKKHEKDKREFEYDLKDLEQANTHDPFWNAAQMEMMLTGKMHGYMRMYWGKKILEWSETPKQAFQYAIYLNNKYELDGRDPNGFAGVAWCFGKHDRAWGERPIFGKIRYMSVKGLKRKGDLDKYIENITNYYQKYFNNK